jgi:hypothetical protein
MDKENIAVLYYDASDSERLQDFIEPLKKYFERNDIKFILLPKNLLELKYCSKKDVLKQLDDLKKEVEKWD